MTGRRNPARDMEAARDIARQAASLGGAAYYVGGFVRDRLLGRENTDVDIEVHGVTPRQLAEILDGMGGRLEMGASFGIYGLKGYGLDIAMPRRERATGRAARPASSQLHPSSTARAATLWANYSCGIRISVVNAPSSLLRLR